MNDAQQAYPRLLRRLQGVFIDGIVIPIVAIGTLVALAYAGVDSTWVKVLCPLLVVFLLEPVAVSMTGGSIGHHMVGLRVRKEQTDERIGIFSAVIRLVVKTLFGLPAFFVAFVTRKRQGLHDLLARSIVVHKSTTGIPLRELLPERTRKDEHATYVSIWRRILVIVLYWVLFYFVWSLVVYVVLAGPCVQYGKCSSTQAMLALAATVVLILVLIAFVVLGWRGSLYGCRKSPAPNAS